jgi:hypothetical protein
MSAKALSTGAHSFGAYGVWSARMKTCVIIPVYNHQEAIGHVIGQLKPFGLPCFLVNDGNVLPC